MARRRALVGDWRTVEGVAGFFAAGSAFEAFLQILFQDLTNFIFFILKRSVPGNGFHVFDVCPEDRHFEF